MPRRPAPTPLKLHPGPTPARNFVKFTLPTMPQQSFYPTVVPAVQSLKTEQKYFTRRGHKRTSSSSSNSSVDSDDSATSASADGTASQLPTARELSVLQRIESVYTLATQLPKVMTRGPRMASEGGGGMALPEYRSPSSNSVQSPTSTTPSVRRIEMMGPWEYSKLRLSEAEIQAMVPPPKPAVANPCPVTW